MNSAWIARLFGIFCDGVAIEIFRVTAERLYNDGSDDFSEFTIIQYIIYGIQSIHA